jgi:NAD(P)-dependent dehydrogenase (short-subunit alcohol dehydrogenase family)
MGSNALPLVRLIWQAYFRSYHSLSVLVSSTAISFETLVLDSISLHPLDYGQALDAGNAINISVAPRLARARRAARDVDHNVCADKALAGLSRQSQTRRGGILRVASMAGFRPAVYYASKAYVLSFSEALHRELNLQHCCQISRYG